METLIPEPCPDDESRNQDIQRRLAAIELAELLRQSVPFVGGALLAQYPSKNGPN
jgi:hypothetical protein